MEIKQGWEAAASNANAVKNNQPQSDDGQQVFSPQDAPYAEVMPQDQPQAKPASQSGQNESAGVRPSSRQSSGSSHSSNKSWNGGEDMMSSHSIELLAIKSQLKTAQTEIASLQRRNRDLEMHVQEKEYLLQDVITKFKKERTSLKSRILKLEQRANTSQYDQSLDIKPAKGSKSVQQHPHGNGDQDFDSKSEMAATKSEMQKVGVAEGKKRSNNQELDLEAIKQDKLESMSASGAATNEQTKDKISGEYEESKSVSFANEVKGGIDQAVSTKSQSKRKKKSNKKKNDDGESLIDRIVEESKEALKQKRVVPETAVSEGTASSFSSYDQIETKGRYKCRACVQSFMSKNQLEKHRKTVEHKLREKKYSQDHARQMEINNDKDVRFETTFKMACPECGCAFTTEDEFRVHGREHHGGVEFESQPDVVKTRSRVAWKLHFFPLFNAAEYANAAEGCKIACGVVLKNRDDIVAHFFTNHSILNLCEKCQLVLPADIMRFHMIGKCDNIEAIRLMDEDDKKRLEEEKKEAAEKAAAEKAEAAAAAKAS